MIEYGAPRSLLQCDLDKMTTHFNFDKKYVIDTFSWAKSNPTRGKPLLVASANIYTDGSRLKRGQSGAALIVMQVKNNRGYMSDSLLQDNCREDSFYLEDQDIWVCEVFAIKKAAIWIVEHADRFKFTSIDIYIDCLAAIMALKKSRVKSQIVWDTVKLLNMAAECLSGSLTLRWCEAHVEGSMAHRGNALSDELAKRAAESGRALVPEPELPSRTLASVKREVHYYLQNQWARRWVNGWRKNPPCRETKLFFPTLNLSKSKKLLFGGNSRKGYSILLQMITGFNFLAYHETRIGRMQDSRCRYCNVPGTTESPEHIFSTCESFGRLRFKHFRGNHTPTPPFDSLSTGGLLGFLREAEIQWFPEDPVS